MCDLRIDREGNWHYRGIAMSRADIVHLFYRYLQRDESGRFFIDNGKQRCRVEVEDAAYVVWSVHIEATSHASEDCVCLLLSDGSTEELDPATLRIGDDNVPYCLVKNGCFAARFSSSGYYQLAEHIGHDPQCDDYFLSLNGERHYLARAQKGR